MYGEIAVLRDIADIRPAVGSAGHTLAVRAAHYPADTVADLDKDVDSTLRDVAGIQAEVGFAGRTPAGREAHCPVATVAGLSKEMDTPLDIEGTPSEVDLAEERTWVPNTYLHRTTVQKKPHWDRPRDNPHRS